MTKAKVNTTKLDAVYSVFAACFFFFLFVSGSCANCTKFPFNFITWPDTSRESDSGRRDEVAETIDVAKDVRRECVSVRDYVNMLMKISELCLS